MARDLKNLVGDGSVREMQKKLENWEQDYEVNSNCENVNRCCELLELNTAIQKKLFSILGETSQEGSAKKCCLPSPCCAKPCCTKPCCTKPCCTKPCCTKPFCTKPCCTKPCCTKPCCTKPCCTKPFCTKPFCTKLCCTKPFCTKPCCTKPCCVKPCCVKPCCPSGGENSTSTTQDSTEGDLQLTDMSSSGYCRLRDLENKLAETRLQIKEVEQDLKTCCPEECKTAKLQQLNEYEHQIKLLRDEIALLGAQKSCLHNRCCSPIPCCVRKPCVSPCASKPCVLPCVGKPCVPPCVGKPCVPPCVGKPCGPPCVSKLCVPPCESKPCGPPCMTSPCMPPCIRKPCMPTCLRSWSPAQHKRLTASRRACLIARYNFIYARDRLEAETLLRPFVCDIEFAQRIIYLAAVESFRAAKMSFWKVKLTVKETLGLDHVGPEPLEVAALEYIACHSDLYDVCHSVQDVICSMKMNPKLPCPANFDYIVINNLIREVCRLAFAMQTLIPPLDIACGVDGEVFNRAVYYRSFDSDFTAHFVAYHIWPALLENGAVIVKGEAVTKTSVLCPRRCRFRSRSCCCGRRVLCGQVPRSRSLSTVRFKRC